MAYDAEFYRLYQEYLAEPHVKEAHRRALRLLHFPVSRLLELGSGGKNSPESLRHFKLNHLSMGIHYVGIDVNAENTRSFVFDSELIFIQGDYRDIEFWHRTVKKFELNKFDTFFSLFSTEITAPVSQNYSLYRSLFRETDLRQGLVSGFYYSDKLDQNPIEEAGGITSYQTLEPIESDRCPEFTETRLIMHVPSKLFGKNVYEVWKLFLRR